MKIKVDTARCAAMGICESIVPELFEIQDTGEMVLLGDEVPAEFEAQVRLAIDSCPTFSLSLAD